MKAKEIRTRGEARQAAMDWQRWQNNRAMYYSEVSERLTNLMKLNLYLKARKY